MSTKVFFAVFLACSCARATLTFPEKTQKVIINVGSSLDPAVPVVNDGTTIVIAVEPIVGCRIPPLPYLQVIHAAVAAKPSLTTMQVYNTEMCVHSSCISSDICSIFGLPTTR